MERMQEEMEYPESRRTFLEAVGGNLGVTGSLSLVFTAANGQQQTTSQSGESPLVGRQKPPLPSEQIGLRSHSQGRRNHVSSQMARCDSLASSVTLRDWNNSAYPVKY